VVSAAGESFSVGSGMALFNARPHAAGEYVFRPKANVQRFRVGGTVGEDGSLPPTDVLGWHAPPPLTHYL